MPLLRPAINSTDDPPIPIQNIQLSEYIYALRRRIEIQDIQLEQLALDNSRLQTEVDKLALDLHFKSKDLP